MREYFVVRSRDDTSKGGRREASIAPFARECSHDAVWAGRAELTAAPDSAGGPTHRQRRLKREHRARVEHGDEGVIPESEFLAACVPCEPRWS